jgi:Mn-dependent DtxR family transcriptional regulator
MSMLTRPTPLRDQLLAIMRAANGPLTTAEIAARVNQKPASISAQLCKMRAYGYIDSVKPPPPPPRQPQYSSWTLRERR